MSYDELCLNFFIVTDTINFLSYIPISVDIHGDPDDMENGECLSYLFYKNPSQKINLH